MSTRHLAVIGALLLTTALPLPAQPDPPPAPHVPDASQFVGQPAGAPLEGAALDRRTSEVSALLRCPVCQGLAVADSPAEMAVNMKGQVRELLSRGYTEEQILSYFEQSYGQFVLLRPKFEGLNMLVWLFPVIVLILGAAIVWVKVKKLEKGPARPPVQAAVAEEDPYLARVRDLVGGGKP
ncbi:MAG TPA: cytochrome c-type biogenesis protein [Thermoanaerobaculia bacterium]|nr:cytochrome c-type biogenesis protein [Thermoanaerobaculia bacterium]